jgi:hypothetical protein
MILKITTGTPTTMTPFINAMKRAHVFGRRPIMPSTLTHVKESDMLHDRSHHSELQQQQDTPSQWDSQLTATRAAFAEAPTRARESQSQPGA